MSTQLEGFLVPEWTFADRIRKIRKTTGLNQVEFAERIGRGDKAVASWELGTNQPRDIVALAKRIEIAFGVPATWTLGLDEGGGPDGQRGPVKQSAGQIVRHQGLEPRTRCLGVPRPDLPLLVA